MKEQGKNPPEQTNEPEIGSLPEKEFIVVIVKMIQNLGNGDRNTSELQSLTTISYAVFCLKKKTGTTNLEPAKRIPQNTVS